MGTIVLLDGSPCRAMDRPLRRGNILLGSLPSPSPAVEQSCKLCPVSGPPAGHGAVRIHAHPSGSRSASSGMPWNGVVWGLGCPALPRLALPCGGRGEAHWDSRRDACPLWINRSQGRVQGRPSWQWRDCGIAGDYVVAFWGKMPYWMGRRIGEVTESQWSPTRADSGVVNPCRPPGE
jgi:hypothetical protein